MKTYPLETRLRVCHELSVSAVETLGGAVVHGAAGGRMIAATWAHASGTYYAILELAEAGFGAQVVMLARALFEGMVDAHWIASNPDEAQRLAVMHFRQTRLLVAGQYNAHERRDGDAALPLFAEDIRDRDEMAALFGATGHRHWTRKSLSQRIARVDADVSQGFPGELRHRHEYDNKLANLILHGAAMALNDQLTDLGAGAVTVAAGPSEQHLANGLRHAYWSYQRLIRLVARRRSESAVAALDDLYLSGWPLLQSITVALRHAGRNGDCPCGSGKKVKQCHGSLLMRPS